MLRHGAVAAAVLLAGCRSPSPVVPGSVAALKVTQTYLVALCLDDKKVPASEREWALAPGEHVLVFTMRNDPRPGVGTASPGTARVRFTPAPGHRYEAEVRAPSMAFSSRVWAEGDWKPVIRDRSVDQIVSGEPEWTAGSCSSGT